MTPLIVCVDDFGADGAVNGSVFALAAMGRISAVSCLVDGPRWVRDAPWLRNAARGRLDIGLHLNLTEPFPDGPPRPGWASLVCRAYAGRLPQEALRREIARQLDAFTAAFGQPPDFVDGHRHVHQLPSVRQALLAVLQARALKPWLRCTLPRAGAGGFKPWVIGRLGARALAREAARNGLAMNDRLLGVYGFDADEAAHARRLAGWLAAAQPGDLLMCHPALPDSTAAARDPIAAARRAEHAVLAGPACGRLFDAAGVEIRRGSEILPPPA